MASTCQATPLSACSIVQARARVGVEERSLRCAPQAALLRQRQSRSSNTPLSNVSKQLARKNERVLCKRSSYFGAQLNGQLDLKKRKDGRSRERKLVPTARLKGEYDFTVKGDLDRVFEYASDFNHIDAWDPGTPESHKDSSLTRSKEAPIGVGTQFTLRTVLLGYITPTVYEILEYKSPSLVKFYGVSDFHDSYDTVSFKRDERDRGLAHVKYVSEIQLTGWYKVYQPIMGWLLIRLFKDAVRGLEDKMKSIEHELQPMAQVK